VSREVDPSNRSAVTLDLTARGQRLVADVAAWRKRELTRILHGLEPAERATLTGALRMLVKAAGDGYGALPHNPVPL
jgi:DNA-binding MarR family transcriptional regulator